MTLIMLISIPISMAIIIPLGRIMHKVAKATQAEMAKFSGHLGRVLGDIRLVKASRAEKAEAEQGQKAIRSLFGFGLKEAKIQAVISPIMTLTMMSILVVILGYGGSQVSRGDFISRYTCRHYLFHVSNYCSVCADGIIFHFIPKSGWGDRANSRYY